MSFANVIGLEQPAAVLRRAIAAERVSHAYLLHGPANIGKTLLAHEFAKVRHLYAARLKLADRCEIEFFDGGHEIHSQGAFDFLHRHLKWPKSAEDR